LIISLISGCLPVSFLEKIRFPFIVISRTPPEEGISSNEETGRHPEINEIINMI